MIEVNKANALSWARMSSRKCFGYTMSEMGGAYDNLIVLAADVSTSAGLQSFIEKYPEKFLNVGIAEQNMIGVACGLANEGYNVIVTSFAPFVSMRCFEMVRSYIGYMNLNVKLVGIASGLSMEVQGNTHFGLEDVALMRTVPNMTVVSPADCTETVKATCAALDFDGPLYLRLTGVPGSPSVYQEDYTFNIGKGIVLNEGADVAIIAAGTMVYESRRALKPLAKQGISATVVDMHTIKPLDVALLDSVSSTHKLLVTIEEHFLSGGLGSSVAEYLADTGKKNHLLRIGLPDKFGQAAHYATLMDEYGLTAGSIASSIQQALEKVDNVKCVTVN